MSIIRVYDLNEVRRFLNETYGLVGGNIVPTEEGLDNSVYFIDQASLDGVVADFVFKIVETKSAEQIDNSVVLAKKSYGITNRLTFYPSKTTDRIVSIFSSAGKPTILSNRVLGQHPQIGVNISLEEYAKFISDFHSFGESEKDLSGDFAKREFQQVCQYWTEQNIKGIKRYTPRRMGYYRDLVEWVFTKGSEIIFDAQRRLPSNIGYTHGDLNPGNIIILPDGEVTAIDFDGANEKGYHLTDLFQAAGKSEVGHSIYDIRSFFSSYFDYSLSHGEQQACLRWLGITSLRAALSTEYYTHVIQKLSPNWNISHASEVIDRLLDTALMVKNHVDQMECKL